MQQFRQAELCLRVPRGHVGGIVQHIAGRFFRAFHARLFQHVHNGVAPGPAQQRVHPVVNAELLGRHLNAAAHRAAQQRFVRVAARKAHFSRFLPGCGQRLDAKPHLGPRRRTGRRARRTCRHPADSSTNQCSQGSYRVLRHAARNVHGHPARAVQPHLGALKRLVALLQQADARAVLRRQRPGVQRARLGHAKGFFGCAAVGFALLPLAVFAARGRLPGQQQRHGLPLRRVPLRRFVQPLRRFAQPPRGAGVGRRLSRGQQPAAQALCAPFGNAAHALAQPKQRAVLSFQRLHLVVGVALPLRHPFALPLHLGLAAALCLPRCHLLGNRVVAQRPHRLHARRFPQRLCLLVVLLVAVHQLPLFGVAHLLGLPALQHSGIRVLGCVALRRHLAVSFYPRFRQVQALLHLLLAHTQHRAHGPVFPLAQFFQSAAHTALQTWRAGVRLPRPASFLWFKSFP